MRYSAMTKFYPIVKTNRNWLRLAFTIIFSLRIIAACLWFLRWKWQRTQS